MSKPLSSKQLASELRFPVRSLSRKLSTKLSVGILLLAVPIFVISLGLLFNQSRHMIRNEAVGRANSVLSTTMQRVCRNLATIETVTNAYSWLIIKDLYPDSLLAISHRVVSLNPHIDGCSISTEPYVFQEFGKYFSAYSVRKTKTIDEPSEQVNDSVGTVIEEIYDYFDKVWYKKPHDLGEPCWVVYYDESDSLALTLDGMIASYSKPLYDNTNKFIGIISTDLSLLRLSKIITQEKPYPNSYFIMVDEEGHYFIHPDSSRLFTQSIFDDAKQADLIALGHEMTTGSQGSMAVDVDGSPCLVCYQPVPGTTWSLAIVCPDSDILKGYHQLSIIIVSLLIAGLIIILLLCHRTVNHAIRPLNELLAKTQSIAEGNMEVYIPRSQRVDAVGRLQNSFASMLQSLNFHMGSVRYTTEQAMRRNEELEQATRLAEEADRQKTAFIQNVSHQIRTPLNIIMGFTQILNDQHTTSNPTAKPSDSPLAPNATSDASSRSYSLRDELSEEEIKNITDTMKHNAILLKRLVSMLFDSSETGLTEEVNSHKLDMVPCNDVAREAIGYIILHYPDITIPLQTNVDDDFCIQTKHLYLMRSLREILYNSAKYSDRQHVSLTINRSETTISFIIQDKGKGIAEADRELMFKFFTKVDDLSEGLGLGLPLSKRHAQHLGGDLTLDPDYHDGCRFILELPLN